jgi:aldehyde dehydrogenase (NAD+)
VAADGTAADMDAAIGAARRRSTRHRLVDRPAFGPHCLRQLRDALVRRRRAARADHRRGRARRVPHLGTPVRRPRSRTSAGTRPRRVLRVDAPTWARPTRRGAEPPLGAARGGRRGRCDHPVELPAPDQPRQARPRARRRLHRGAQARPRHAVGAAPVARIAAERDRPARPACSTWSPRRTHALGAQLSTDPRVDVVSFTGSTATGKRSWQRRPTPQAGVPRARRQVGVRRARRRRHGRRRGHGGLHGVHPRRPGLRHHHPAAGPPRPLRRGRRGAAATMAALGAGDPTDPGTVCGPVISARQRDRIEGYLRLAVRRAARSPPAAAARAEHDRGLLHRADAGRGPRQLVAGRPRGDLRPGARGDPPRRRRRRRAHRQRLALRPVGSVFSGDEERAWAVAARIRTGTMSVNGGVWYAADVPFGGYKQSGIGREMGVPGSRSTSRPRRSPRA